MSVLYTAHATTTKGREGHTATDDKRIDMKLSKPGSSEGTNPEQLFAAGYSACFGSACAAIAQKEKLETGDISVTADVSLNQEGSEYSISAVLTVSAPKLDQQAAQQLAEKAHKVCPYSKATRGNIDVQVKGAGGKQQAVA